MAVERLATLGQLTAGLAHEVNTPLAAAMNTLENARNLSREYRNSIGHAEVTDADHREIASELDAALERTSSTLERLGELVRKMRAQGRDHQQGHVRFSPVSAAHEALALLEHSAMKARVDFRIEDISNGVSIHGEVTRFMQVVTNLVGNAIHACEDHRHPAGSRVTLQFTHDNQHLVMFVIDNGCGIPPEVQERMFEALYTTKSVGRGTGLGLSIVKDIVQAHFAGTISFETTLGVGTTFCVCLPLAVAPVTNLDNTLNAGQIREASATLPS
jgi:signal transduction histidine kinase